MATYDVPSQAKGVRLVDLDNDGRLDLIYTARGSSYKGDLKIGRLFVRQGLPDWKFGQALECDAGPSAYYAETADLNNDGYLDILVPNATPDQPQKPIEEYDAEFYQLLVLQHLTNHLIDRNTRISGKVRRKPSHSAVFNF